MWKLKNKFFVILSAILILMAGSGTGIVAADYSAGDNSTIVNEEYSIEETNFDYEEINTEENTAIIADESEDVIISEGPVTYEEENTDITDIDTTYSDDDYNYTYSDDDVFTSVDEKNIAAENNSSVSVYDDVTNINDSSYNDYSYNSETNIYNTEITQVTLDNSKTVSIDIKNDNSVVNNVYFVPTKDSGKAKVVVEDLNAEYIKKPPTGVVYKSFNIFIDNDNKQIVDIDNAAVDFKVEKSWLKANSLDKSAIVLNMYEDGKWVEVPITITKEDSKYIYFNAEVSEYSTFAITSKTITVDKVLKQTAEVSSEEEIDKPTKNVVIKLLEVIIEILKGE